MLTGTVRTAEVTPPARSPFSFARSSRVDTAQLMTPRRSRARAAILAQRRRVGNPGTGLRSRRSSSMMRDPSHHMEDADDAQLDARMRARMRLAGENERRPMTERLIRLIL